MKKSRSQHQHSIRKGRKTKLKLRALALPCSYCIIIMRHRYEGAFTIPSAEAFTLSTSVRDLMRKNKKCRGPNCSQASDPSNGESANIGVFGNRKDAETFALRMACFHEEEMENMMEFDSLTDVGPSTFPNEDVEGDVITLERRKFLHSLFAASSVAAGLPMAANGYENSYPQNLDFIGDDTSINLESIRQERISVKISRAKNLRSELTSNPLALRSKADVFGSVIWGAALWLLSGSRSNPLVKPLGNILYDENTEKGAWVKDRNEGLFTPFPATFAIVMGVVFLAIGVLTDKTLLFATQGETALVLQLAGVSFMTGGTVELGRIATGVKTQTREEEERDTLLASEFSEFASKKLIIRKGGSVHRSDVTKSFRRYFAKYRVENEEYPLVDLEIENLLRNWNMMNGSIETISAAGFLKGVQINSQSEIR